MEEEEGWLKLGHSTESNILNHFWEVVYLKRDSAGSAAGF
jgi:hypothetical protein